MRLKTPLDWFRDLFPPRDVSQSQAPIELVENLQPVFPVLDMGSHWHGKLKMVTATGAVNAKHVSSALLDVPAGKVWHIITANATQSIVPSTAKYGSFYLREPTGFDSIFIGNNHIVLALHGDPPVLYVTDTRTEDLHGYIVPPLWRLCFVSSNIPAVGASFRVRVLYAELDVGKFARV